MLQARETYERTAELFGAVVNKTSVCAVDAGGGLRINIHQEPYWVWDEKRGRVRIRLVRLSRKNGKPDQELLEETVLADGASDRSIMNRVNKMKRLIEAEKKSLYSSYSM